MASAASVAKPEVVAIGDPVPGVYSLYVFNYEGGTEADDWTGGATFIGPDPAIVTGIQEAWTLTCAPRRVVCWRVNR